MQIPRSFPFKAAILGTSILLAAGASACTIIFAFRGGSVFAAGNEDEVIRAQLASHFVRFEPANKEKGTLGFVAFGYKNNPFSDESAMNEAGLFYDFNALDPLQTPREGKPKGGFSTINQMLVKCKTVAEAVSFLESVDLPQMSAAQLLLGDATGASAIVERHATTWRAKNQDFQIGTNFRTSTTPESKITCERFKLCNTTLSSKQPISLIDMATMLRKTAAVAHGITTWYSLVCDLKKGDIYLSVKGDFSKTIKLNLHTELKMGSRRVDMEELVATAKTHLDWGEPR